VKRSAIWIILTGALGGLAVAQSPTTSPTPQNSADQRRADQSREASSNSRDPSSTRNRPDASYPNPSGQDTKTDAAAKPHKDKGHDDASDTAKVKPTPSAGPSGGEDTYTASTGKKAAPQADCENAKQASRDARTANSSAASKSEKCVGAQASTDGADRRATAPPPGSTAPIHRE
jgi:hypothetical protein